MQVPILAFHKVDSSFEWGVTRITPKRFRSLICRLKEMGYQGISVQQLFDPAFVLPPKPVGITFDDGYQKLYENAIPILQEAGFGASIYIVTDYIGKLNAWDVNLGGFKFMHLSWPELREIHQAGFEIGSHTKSHLTLNWLNEDAVRHELADSKKILEDGLGDRVFSVSYPFGRYNETVVRETLACGYGKACAFFRKEKILEEFEESVVLKRKAYYIFDTYQSLKAKLEPSIWTELEDLKLRLVNWGSYGTSLVKALKQ